MTKGNFEFTDYADIQDYIREARLERSVAVANLIAEAVDAAWRGLKILGNAAAQAVKASNDARSVEAHALMHRAVHH